MKKNEQIEINLPKLGKDHLILAGLAVSILMNVFLYLQMQKIQVNLSQIDEVNKRLEGLNEIKGEISKLQNLQQAGMAGIKDLQEKMQNGRGQDQYQIVAQMGLGQIDDKLRKMEGQLEDRLDQQVAKAVGDEMNKRRPTSTDTRKNYNNPYADPNYKSTRWKRSNSFPNPFNKIFKPGRKSNGDFTSR